MILRLKNGVLALVFVSILAIIIGEKNDKKVVCYYTNWSAYRTEGAKFLPKDIQPNLCTHIIYSFLTFSPDSKGIASLDTYQDYDKKGFEEFIKLKTQNKDLKLLVALGGWNEGSKRFSDIASHQNKTDEFTKGTIKFLVKNKFDGINIDWQFPGFREGSRHEDINNFVNFLKTMRHEFNEDKSGLLLTMSVPSNTEYIEKGFNLQGLQAYTDFITVLCYDYHLSTDLVVNHHSPIYALPDADEIDNKLNIDWTIDYILKKGVPKEKLILGIPSYGRTYYLEDETKHGIGSPSGGEGTEGNYTKQVGSKAYYEICQEIVKNNWTVVHVNKTAIGPYAYKGKNWVGYDDEESSRKKGEYARDHNLGGIMFWTIDNDDFKGDCGRGKNPLINAAKQGFYSSPKPTQTPKSKLKTTS